jgi:hypothetical protein
MKSRGALLIASKEIHNIFTSGPQIVLSSKYRPNNAPSIEIQNMMLIKIGLEDV